MGKNKPGPKKGEAQQKRWQWMVDGLAITGNAETDAAITRLKSSKDLNATQIGNLIHEILAKYYTAVLPSMEVDN